MGNLSSELAPHAEATLPPAPDLRRCQCTCRPRLKHAPASRLGCLVRPGRRRIATRPRFQTLSSCPAASTNAGNHGSGLPRRPPVSSRRRRRGAGRSTPQMSVCFRPFSSASIAHCFARPPTAAVMRVPAPCRSWGGRCMFTRIGTCRRLELSSVVAEIHTSCSHTSSGQPRQLR